MTCDPMWIFASSHRTSFPFIHIFSDFGKDIGDQPPWLWTIGLDSSPPSPRCQRWNGSEVFELWAVSAARHILWEPYGWGAQRLLLLAAGRAAVGPGMQRLAAVPAKSLLWHLPSLEALADVLHLRGRVIDLPRCGKILEQFSGPL